MFNGTPSQANDGADSVKTLRNRLSKREKTIGNLRAQVAELQAAAAAQKEAEGPVKSGYASVSQGLPQFVRNVVDGVDRCVTCSWEVVEGFCDVCQKQYQWEEPTEKDELYEPKDSLHTNITYDPDRVQAPRGDTPLPDIGRAIRPVAGYSPEHYMALLQRGATRLMIETFNLEFTYETGIFAWADSTLYEQFAGPKMLEGDFWKIQLGRRFYLNDEDLDGASFIEGVLEDAVLFAGKDGARWDTVEESPGIWVTKIIMSAEDVEKYGMDDTDDDDEEEDSDGSEEEEGEIDEKETTVKRAQPRLIDPFLDDGPVLLRPGYDTSDDHSFNDERMAIDDDNNPHTEDADMIDDMSIAIQAHVPDTIYNVHDADLDSMSAPEETTQTLLLPQDHHGQQPVKSEVKDEELEVITLDSDSDSADSDFDDDERMSGDEEVIHKIADPHGRRDHQEAV
ncbi:hypothetical protein DXG01_016969 [Tephrocybe rancida]|nr:hypothetical protein DXG01_016969 [Tephrocybe rancida]